MTSSYESDRGRSTAIVVLAVVAGVAGATGAGLGVGGRALLKRQAAATRAIIGKPLGEDAPDADRVYRKRYAAAGPPLQLLILGDSIAAGLGAEDRRGTLGARLSKGLSKATQRPVQLTTGAVVGSQSSMLPEQLAGLPPAYRPDVSVIVVGGNDVTHRVPVTISTDHLTDAIEVLRGRDSAVVVGTCPDLGMLRMLPQPLRSLASRGSRQLAQAQAAAAVEAGAYAVALAHVAGPFFLTNPDEMFSLDRFHPSALGYRRTAEAILPSVLAALGVADGVPFGHHAPAGPAEPESEDRGDNRRRPVVG